MLEEEISELVERARGIQSFAAMGGHTLNCIGATATAFMVKGREDLLTLPKGKEQIAEDINSYAYGLSPSHRDKFFKGMGYTLVGSILIAVENACWNGWSDDEYISYYNKAITGTNLPAISLDYFIKAGFTPVPAEAETKKIIRVLNSDPSKTFTNFLYKENLPSLVENHFSCFSPEVMNSYNEKAILYREVIKKTQSLLTH